MTKQLCVIMTLLIMGSVMTAAAQNRRIAFNENEPWQEVVDKAKQNGRIIFMDCYTTWCGPCKMLDRDVFSNDRIADCYNEKFVNAKYDMEKGEGIALKEKYGISAYPTLLFIDARTQEVIHRVAGAGSVEHMMTQAEIATDPANNLQGIRERYEAGEKNARTLAEYVTAMRRAAMSGEINDVTVEYLSGLDNARMMEEENWKLFESNVTDPLSEPSLRVFADRDAFSRTIGEKRVNDKLVATLMIAVNRFRTKEPEPVDNFDQKRFDALVALLSQQDDEASRFNLIQLQTAGYAQHRQYDEMIDALRTAATMKHAGPEQVKSIYIMTYLGKLIGREDGRLQKQAIGLADYMIEISKDPSDKLPYVQIKMIMLESYGDKEGAQRADEELQKLRESGAGPRMMRMG